MHESHMVRSRVSGGLLRDLLIGAAGGGVVLAGTSPAFLGGARRVVVAALTLGILLGRALARAAEEARLGAEDIFVEAQAAAGASPTQGGTASHEGQDTHGH
jgi:hypothetical protein